MDCWPPKNGESSTAAQKYSERSTCGSSNRVIMLQGLDPNSTQSRIKKAFEDNGLKVTVDYQRDETIGYVHLHLPMAKEVVSRITTSGGLRIGSEYVVLRALEGTEEVMYWSVYAAANLPTSFRSPGKNKRSSRVRNNKMRNRTHPYSSSYQTMDIDEDASQAFEKTLSKLQKKKHSKLKRIKGHKKPKKVINNRTAAKQFHMQLKATIDLASMSVVKHHDDPFNEALKMCVANHEQTLNSLLKKEGVNNDMLRSTIITERSSDYSLHSIQSLATNSSGMFGICSPYQYPTHQQIDFGVEMENETRENVQPYNHQLLIKVDETDEVEEKFKHLSVNSRNELMNEFGGEYYHN